jgi:hypothetical protein
MAGELVLIDVDARIGGREDSCDPVMILDKLDGVAH